jgi:RHS repeat-associated protein
LPEQLTDADGETLWRSDYQGWGRTRDEWHSQRQAREQNLRYQGQYLDRETGLQYNTFRFYEPEIGRYIQADPIALKGGLNLYAYVSNPQKWIDPLGLKCLEFSDSEKLTSHFKKHGGEFRARSESEYLAIGHDIIKNGHKIQYTYKGEPRIGYIMYLGNTSKGATKMGFVGTNQSGNITTIHTKSGKDLWRAINGNSQSKTVNTHPRNESGL